MSDPGADEPSWTDLIGYYAIQRRRIAELRPEVSPMTAPHLAASPDEIAAAETRLGHRLDRQHRELLEHGNGWPAMYLDIDLFSTDELGQGPAWDKAQAILDDIDREWPLTEGFPAREHLLPIGVSADQTDVIVVWTTGPTTDGGRPTSWLIPSDEVERYSNLREMFLDAIRLVQRRIDKVESSRGQG